jgi:hypothetical protein
MREKEEDFIESVKGAICLFFFIATWLSVVWMLMSDSLLDVLKNGFSAIVYALMFMHFTPRVIIEEEEDDND